MKDLNFLKKKHSLHLKRKIPRFKEKKFLIYQFLSNRKKLYIVVQENELYIYDDLYIHDHFGSGI